MKILAAVALVLFTTSGQAQSYYNQHQQNGYYNQPRQAPTQPTNYGYTAPNYGYTAPDRQTNGYVKQDGTYVAPYHATMPNATKIDNYSSQGNYNPYTGQYGTKK